MELLPRRCGIPGSAERGHERGIRPQGTPNLGVPRGESLTAQTKRFDAIEVHQVALVV